MNPRSAAVVDVRLGERSYAIEVGSGLYAASPSYARLPRGSSAVIVSNETVAALYARPLASALVPLYPKVEIVVVRDGEEFKTWQTLQAIFDGLVDARADRSSTVFALGGGVVLRPANRELLRSRTCCVYLRASSELLWKRLRNDRRRPLLQVADPQARLRQMHAERAPLYEEVAHLVIDTDGLPFARIVDEVVRGVEAEVGP